MAKDMEITAELARQLLDYDPSTGVFRWKERTENMFKDTGRNGAKKSCAIWNSRYAGAVAGTPNDAGYRQIRIFNRHYFEHRLVVLIMTGEWPDDETDHENLHRSDNRWENIRPATGSQNQANQSIPASNTSGAKGVTWDKTRGKWRAQIKSGNRAFNLGRFDTIEAARAAYVSAAKRLHGEFARAA